jgi:hypothetical protein
MQCSTCGGTQFERETDEGPFRCAGCGRSFTREELIRENGELIDSEVDEMAAEVVKDTREQLRESLRQAFSGSKNIKFK